MFPRHGESGRSKTLPFAAFWPEDATVPQIRNLQNPKKPSYKSNLHKAVSRLVSRTINPFTGLAYPIQLPGAPIICHWRMASTGQASIRMFNNRLSRIQITLASSRPANSRHDAHTGNREASTTPPMQAP